VERVSHKDSGSKGQTRQEREEHQEGSCQTAEELSAKAEKLVGIAHATPVLSKPQSNNFPARIDDLSEADSTTLASRAQRFIEAGCRLKGAKSADFLPNFPQIKE
jgi:hypothetical protein